jgi:hypothetical protein
MNQLALLILLELINTVDLLETSITCGKEQLFLKCYIHQTISTSHHFLIHLMQIDITYQDFIKVPLQVDKYLLDFNHFEANLLLKCQQIKL